MGVAQVVSLGLAIVACGWDLKTRRIPQVLTLGGALAGFAFHLTAGGPGAGVGSAVGWVVGIAIFFVPFALGRTRGWRRQAAWRDRRVARSYERACGSGLYAGAAGGVLAIFVALTKGYLFRAVGNVGVMLAYWRVNGVKPLPEMTLEHSRGPRLAYAVPILAGTMVTLWLK